MAPLCSGCSKKGVNFQPTHAFHHNPYTKHDTTAQLTSIVRGALIDSHEAEAEDEAEDISDLPIPMAEDEDPSYPPSPPRSPAELAEDEEPKRGENDNFCHDCHEGGELVLCDGCLRSFHFDCCDFESSEPDT